MLSTGAWVWFIWPAIIAIVCGGAMLQPWFSSRRFKTRWVDPGQEQLPLKSGDLRGILWTVA